MCDKEMQGEGSQMQSNLKTNQLPDLIGIFVSQRFILKHKINDL